MTAPPLLYQHISEQDTARILGVKKRVPLTPETMAAGLRVTFFPVTSASERVRAFTERLREALLRCGASVLDYAAAAAHSRPGKLQENLIIIAAGELATGDLPVDHVQNLRTTTIVGIVDGPCPAVEETADQEKLNRIVRTLTWSIVQVAIYVDADRWTITTMNGAVIPCSQHGPLTQDVLNVLVPKLAAPVVPPRAADFDLRPGLLDLNDQFLWPYVDDFVRSGPIWQQTGLLLFHTSMEELEFRNAWYKRIAAAYLDHRSGMSYGFLARQTASTYYPPWMEREVPEKVVFRLADSEFQIAAPSVWVLTTRSGCDKSRIDPSKDLLMMGLSQGRAIIATPKGLNPQMDSKPSYDTLTILAHAVANALVASLLNTLRTETRFTSMIAQSGAALAHWHGDVPEGAIPAGYSVHGTTNPPVSCSTYQAALFAFAGKIGAVAACLRNGTSFEGDIHIEPHHGVNVTGSSLLDLARWAMAQVVGRQTPALSQPQRHALAQ
jgi:hypothetical protein